MYMAYNLVDSTIIDCWARTSGGTAFLDPNFYGVRNHRLIGITLLRTKIINCRAIRGAGGGLYVDSDKVTLIESTISGCFAGKSAGCMYANGPSVIRASVIERCTTSWHSQPEQRIGGCLVLGTTDDFGGFTNYKGTGATILIVDTRIQHCHAEGGGGAVNVLQDARVEVIRSNITNSSSETGGGGMFVQFGSSVSFTSSVVSRCTAVGGDGGGLFFFGSFAQLSSSLFEANSARRGGAIFIPVGSARRVVIEASTVSDNSATVRGGGIDVTDAVVLLTEGTLLQGNAAPQGSTTAIQGASVTYALPSSLGHWIPATECRKYHESCPSTFLNCDRTQLPLLPAFQQPCDYDGVHATVLGKWIHVLPDEALNVDYPYSCGSGINGASAAIEDQSSAICAGQCPGGFTCGRATTQPKLCPIAAFCPRGSSAALLCPAGTYSSMEGLSSPDQCIECPKGSACSVGSPIPTFCNPGSFTELPGQAICTSCVAGKFQESAGATQCVTCPAGDRPPTPPQPQPSSRDQIKPQLLICGCGAAPGVCAPHHTQASPARPCRVVLA